MDFDISNALLNLSYFSNRNDFLFWSMYPMVSPFRELFLWWDLIILRLLIPHYLVTKQIWLLYNIFFQWLIEHDNIRAYENKFRLANLTLGDPRRHALDTTIGHSPRNFIIYMEINYRI